MEMKKVHSLSIQTIDWCEKETNSIYNELKRLLQEKQYLIL